jgi:hypothetical protein
MDIEYVTDVNNPRWLLIQKRNAPPGANPGGARERREAGLVAGRAFHDSCPGVERCRALRFRAAFDA